MARIQGTARAVPHPIPPGSLLLDRWSFLGRRNSLSVHHHRRYRLRCRRRFRRSARRAWFFCSGSGSCFPLQGLPLQAGLLLHLRLATPHLHRNATVMLSHGRAPSLDRPGASSRMLVQYTAHGCCPRISPNSASSCCARFTYSSALPARSSSKCSPDEPADCSRARYISPYRPQLRARDCAPRGDNGC